jgi:predicted aminopeptidase
MTTIASNFLKVLYLTTIIIALTACESMSYYHQALSGQLEILQLSKNTRDLIESNHTSNKLKTTLTKAEQIRQFAINQLHLPDNGSYTQYANLNRKYVVWNVVATPEFSLTPLSHCYPLIGCLSYRGFFGQKVAEQYANTIKHKNFDVYVSGVKAYSTLGWFADPLLNTFIHQGETYLAKIIFHELAHQLIFIPGETAFNESFASTVEDIGLQLWREKTLSIQPTKQHYDYHKDFIDLIKRYKLKLNHLYKSNTPLMTHKKEQIFQHLLSDYQQLKKQKWSSYPGYDHWFKPPLNNAKISTISIYNDLKPAFEKIFKDNKHNLKKFYQQVTVIGKMNRKQRQQYLAELQSNTP